MRRTLVTTALEETWPAEGHSILFLGEWCKRFSKKSSWENRKGQVLDYHWADRQKLYNDYLHLQDLYEELLVETSLRLNELHGTNFSERYWRILIGPWLNYFIHILYDRWSCISEAIKLDANLAVKVLSRSEGELVPNDMAEFTSIMVTDEWNEKIYADLLGWVNIPVEVVFPLKQTEVFARPLLSGLFLRLRQKLTIFLNKLSCALSKDSNYFIKTGAIPLVHKFWLQWRVGQLPYFWYSKEIPKRKVNLVFRTWDSPKVGSYDDFDAIIRNMIPRHMPVAYLEGYSKLSQEVKSYGWPMRPKVVFTDTDQNADDFFKVWAATTMENGSPILVGQHGGSYGIMKWFGNEEHEKIISNCYLTWGWSDASLSNIHPVGILKLLNNISKNNSVDNKLLLVQQSLPRYSYKPCAEPIASLFLRYIEQQFDFLESLPSNISKAVTVRLHKVDYGWDQAKRWSNRFPDIRIDFSGSNFIREMQESKIVVATYNGTTFLESMTLNIPTIIFWDPNHWELRASAIPDFMRLKSAGIFHETPESAAKQISLIWGDVATWWESSELQSVRREFCKRYARIPDKNLDVVVEILHNVANKSAD
jgi:putative transferase (TIGR04331 family)